MLTYADVCGRMQVRRLITLIDVLYDHKVT